MVTLIQLEYIIAIDTYRHFVTASQKCFVTQPTLSMQIKKLEDNLGVNIFDRTKQPIVPTDIGEKIIEQARIIIAESKKVDEIIKTYNNTVTGELHIGIIPSIAPYLLPLFIGNFRRKYPLIKIKITELLTEDIVDKLKNDTIDVGILVTPLVEKGIIEQALYYEEMVLFINNAHPFAQQEHIKEEDVNNEGLWLLNNGHCFRDQVLNLCGDTPSGDHFEYASDSLETIKRMVEVEGGFTLLPEMAETDCSSNTLIKRFSDNTPLREVSLVYTRNYYKKRILDILTEEIKAVIPERMFDQSRGNIAEWRMES